MPNQLIWARATIWKVRMVEGFYNQLVEVLKAHGFERVRGGKGSHEKWRNEHVGRSAHVPRNCKTRHTANGVLKQAGIDMKI